MTRPFTLTVGIREFRRGAVVERVGNGSGCGLVEDAQQSVGPVDISGSNEVAAAAARIARGREDTFGASSTLLEGSRREVEEITALQGVSRQYEGMAGTI